MGNLDRLSLRVAHTSCDTLCNEHGVASLTAPIPCALTPPPVPALPWSSPWAYSNEQARILYAHGARFVIQSDEMAAKAFQCHLYDSKLSKCRCALVLHAPYHAPYHASYHASLCARPGVSPSARLLPSCVLAGYSVLAELTQDPAHSVAWAFPVACPWRRMPHAAPVHALRCPCLHSCTLAPTRERVRTWLEWSKRES